MMERRYKCRSSLARCRLEAKAIIMGMYFVVDGVGRGGVFALYSLKAYNMSLACIIHVCFCLLHVS